MLRPKRGEAAPKVSVATYDSVTGLPTKRLFSALMSQALNRAERSGQQVAVLMVELDHFTLSTDLQGQVNHNMIYRVQAARLRSALRSTDAVARLGDRSFGVLLDRIGSTQDAMTVAQKMQATVSLPFTLEGHEVFLTSRIGIGISSLDGRSESDLLEAAGTAVARAQREGYAIFGLDGEFVARSTESCVAVPASSSR
jgi:diguanylate cyclase (GGDEF)-like protein